MSCRFKDIWLPLLYLRFNDDKNIRRNENLFRQFSVSEALKILLYM